MRSSKSGKGTTEAASQMPGDLRLRWIHEYAPVSHAMSSLLDVCPLPVLVVSVEKATPCRLGDTVPIIAATSPLAGLPTRHQDRLLVVPVRFVADVCVIGRGETAQAILPFDTVSRQHATIRRGKNGCYELIDSGSRNGTFLDGLKLLPGTPYSLADDSHLMFGDLEADFLVPEEFFRVLAVRRMELEDDPAPGGA